VNSDRVAFTKIETACVELGERRDQTRRGFTFAAGERLDVRKELFVGEVRRLAKFVAHASVVAPQFLPLEDRGRRDFHRRSGATLSIRTKSDPGANSSDSGPLQARRLPDFQGAPKILSSTFFGGENFRVR
jgi:hypothetical protein